MMYNLEFIIVKHPAVGKAVMFGREQFHPGIIIEPITPLNDEKSRNAFVDEIWYLYIYTAWLLTF